MRKLTKACRILLVVCVGLSLQGCGSTPPVKVDNGQFTTQDRSKSYLGSNEAIQRLSKEIKTNPSASQFVVKWSALYPGGGPDALFSEEIQYDKQAGTLIQEPFHYHDVTDEMIHTLAERSKSGKASGMADDLPELGAIEEPIATPSK